MQRMLRKGHLNSEGNRLLRLRIIIFLSLKMMILRMTFRSFGTFFPYTFFFTCSRISSFSQLKKQIINVTLPDAKEMAVNKTAYTYILMGERQVYIK